MSTAEHSRHRWLAAVWLILCAAVFVVASMIGTLLGYGTHGDSRAIFEISMPAILQGHYAPSRSVGNPLYEVIASGLWRLGGVTLVNVYSVLISLAATAVFIKLLRFQGSVLTWALPGFMLNPVFITSATSPTEFPQAVFLFVSAIAIAEYWLARPSNWKIAAYVTVSCGLLLTRPDFIFAHIALLGAVLWERGFRDRKSRYFFAGGVAGPLLAGVIIVLLNNGLPSAGGIQSMFGSASLLRRFEVATFGFIIVFGIAGLGAIVLAALDMLKVRRRNENLNAGLQKTLSYFPTTFIEKLFLLTWLLMTFRYLLQPDKIEYILPLVPVSLLALSVKPLSRFYSAVLALSMIAATFLSISLFQRAPGSDSLHFASRLNPGALFQDWNDRRAVQRALDPAFLERLSAIAYPDINPKPSLEWQLYTNGLTSSAGDLVISVDQLYKIDNPRFTQDPKLQSKNYRHVIVCSKEAIRSPIGWRVLQPPVDYMSPDDIDHGVISCWVERG